MNLTFYVYGILISVFGCGIYYLLLNDKLFDPIRRIIPWCTWHFNKVFEKSKKNKMDVEIYEAISFLRNITILGKGKHYSSDTIIEFLVDRQGILGPYYGRMLQMLRQNQPGEAVAYFSEKVNTDIGKDFARLLIQWDAIEARHLMEVLLSHQKNIREVRMTAQKRKDETASDLIYLPVVVNIIVIFINFIYVGYYVDQKELLMLFS